jgi:hypothetical protein
MLAGAAHLRSSERRPRDNVKSRSEISERLTQTTSFYEF